MSKSTDRILEAIDAGLQGSYENAYGEGDKLWALPPEPVCVRCHGELEDGDLCGECRAFLVSDAPDPIRPGVTVTATGNVSGYITTRYAESDLISDLFIDEHARERADRLLDWYRTAVADGSVTVGGTLVPTEVPASEHARPSSGLTRIGEEILRRSAAADVPPTVWFDMPRQHGRSNMLSGWIDGILAEFYQSAADEGLVLVDGPTLEFDDESRGMILYGHGFRLVHSDGSSEPLDATEIVVDDADMLAIRGHSEHDQLDSLLYAQAQLRPEPFRIPSPD